MLIYFLKVFPQRCKLLSLSLKWCKIPQDSATFGETTTTASNSWDQLSEVDSEDPQNTAASARAENTAKIISMDF